MVQVDLVNSKSFVGKVFLQFTTRYKGLVRSQGERTVSHVIRYQEIGILHEGHSRLLSPHRDFVVSPSSTVKGRCFFGLL